MPRRDNVRVLSVGATEVKAGPPKFPLAGRIAEEGENGWTGHFGTVGTARSVGVLLFGPREVFCGADRELHSLIYYPEY